MFSLFFFSFFKIYLFLLWAGVFVAARELSLVVVLGFLAAMASVLAEPGL